jgi:hypothetical protein
MRYSTLHVCPSQKSPSFSNQSFFLFGSQVPGVRSVPQVTTVTPPSQVGGASRAGAVTTLTCQTWMRVTGGQESVRSVSTTQRDRTVACATAVTMETPRDATAEVSDC